MKKDSTYQETFSQLGQSWEVSKQLFDKIQRFTCHLYATTASTFEVNELCNQLFCAKRREVGSSQLPPCRDCLHMHVFHVNTQASIWKCCLQTQPFVADPRECGWTTDDDGFLVIEWMRTPPAPVLELISCKCLHSCKLPSCTCLVNGLACTTTCLVNGLACTTTCLVNGLACTTMCLVNGLACTTMCLVNGLACTTMCLVNGLACTTMCLVNGLACTTMCLVNGLACTTMCLVNGLACTTMCLVNGLACITMCLVNGLACTTMCLVNGLACTTMCLVNGLACTTTRASYRRAAIRRKKNSLQLN